MIKNRGGPDHLAEQRLWESELLYSADVALSISTVIRRGPFLKDVIVL
jgi:hypothetical protein